MTGSHSGISWDMTPSHPVHIYQTADHHALEEQNLEHFDI